MGKQMGEDERKRQEMLAAQKEGGKKSSGPAMDARKEMSKSKEQVEEEMKISLSIRIKPLALDEMDSDELKNKANQIWNTIVALETDKYDYEQRQLDQDYEFKELAERQKLQLRNKAIKKGLDPESFTQKHPPTIHMFSKYERRTDTRTYGDRKKLYEGGAEVIRAVGLSRCGRRSSPSSQSAPPRNCPSGSECDLARRPEIRRLLRVRRRPRLRRLPRSSTRKRKRITRRRRRKRSKFKAGPNFHRHLLGLKSKLYPCNKRHSIRVIASMPRGFLRRADHRPVSRKVHNLQFVIA